jgi:hypothetical protein
LVLLSDSDCRLGPSTLPAGHIVQLYGLFHFKSTPEKDSNKVMVTVPWLLFAKSDPWVRYGCQKIIVCIEDNFGIGKQGNTWNRGNLEDNAIWNISKLECKCKLKFLKKKFHNIFCTSLSGFFGRPPARYT